MPMVVDTDHHEQRRKLLSRRRSSRTDPGIGRYTLWRLLPGVDSVRSHVLMGVSNSDINIVKGMVFPGIEPSKHQTKTKIPSAPPAPAPKPLTLLEYNAGISEKLMEGKTNSQVERREFFQYLQKMRTYSRLQHRTEACNHIRGWFADNLTVGGIPCILVCSKDIAWLSPPNSGLC